jgi:outer membrane receptor for ferrienterochelin and colicins
VIIMTLRILPVVLLLLSPAVVAAQSPPVPTPPPPELAEQTLEELMTIRVNTVSGAVKREQLVTEAPSSVTVVTAQEIATYGWRTLADVLRATRSFYVTYDRNYAYLGSRGFGRPTDYNNRVLVLVNGHRLNDNIYDAIGVGTDFPMDLALVERIEIIRGPGSALYGTSAFFAVVDVITKRGGALSGVEASVESASFNTWRARGSFGTSDGKDRDLLLSVSHMASDGVGTLHFPEYDDENGLGLSHGADSDRASALYATGRLGRLSLEGATMIREKALPTGAWDTVLSDPRTHTVDQRGWFGATWRSDVGQTGLTARAFYDHMRYDGTYASADDIFTEYSGGDWIVGEVTATRALGSRNRVTAGTEYREHLRQLQSIDPGTGMIEDSHRSRQLGLYVQDEVRFTDKLTAVIGARADYWSLDGWSAHQRGGLIFRPDADTALKLLYGSAYRAPNAYERFYTQGTATANPLLRPETLRTGEFVVERYVGGRLRLTAAAYRTHISQLVSQYGDVAEMTWYDNGADVSATGIEFEAERRWTSGVVATGSFTGQRTQEADTRVRLTNSPERLGTFRLETPIVTRLATFAIDWQYVSERMTDRGNTTSAYALTNLTWRYSPRRLRGGSVAASVYNLFDAQYEHPVGAEFRQDVVGQDGRTFSVRATFGF